MSNPVVHFEIGSSNSDRSAKFYSSLFGWEITSSDPTGYKSIDTQTPGGIPGGITVPGMTPRITFYVAVDNAREYLDEATRLGARTIMEPITMDSKTFALFEDLDGNTIGLVEEG